MKVVLINPLSTRPGEIHQKCFAPVNLLYLAGALMESGYSVTIIDANAWGLCDEEIVRKISALRPDLIGISLLSEILVPVSKLAQKIKQSFPAATIITGGPHANAMPERVLSENESIDMVLTGECEDSLVMLCRAQVGSADKKEVPGLYYRREDGIVEKSNQHRNRLKNYKGVLPSARQLLAREYDSRKYYLVLVKQRPVESLLTSRGCPFQCRFCSNIPGPFRPRSPDSVMDEILLRYDMGIRNFDIADANFTFDAGRALDIFDLIIKEKIKISFRFKSRTDGISQEIVDKSRQAGAYLISLGMESGSQAMLDRMNKRTKLATNIQACETVMERGLKLNTGWIVGFPGETEASLDDTVRLITKIKPTTASIGRMVPYPGTFVYEQSKANKTLVGDWTTKSDANAAVPWIKLPWIDSLKTLETITQKVINKTYYRPYYMLNFGKEILGNLNLTLAKYAVQEARKSITNHS